MNILRSLGLATSALALAGLGYALQMGELDPAADEHRATLAIFEGAWKTEVSMAMMPGQTFEGTDTFEMRGGGKWIEGTYEGSFMNMPFAGTTILTWNPETEKVEGVWVDSMQGTLAHMSGEWIEPGKKLHLVADGQDPMSGEKVKEDHVFSFTGENEMEMTMTVQGKERPFMTIKYKK